MSSASDRFIHSTPLPDETAGSIVWRMAQSRHIAVADYCTTEFGLSYSQARGDLDDSLAHRFARVFSERLRIGQRNMAKIRIAHSLLAPAFRSESKRFDQPIRVCFDCMREAPYGRRLWRTRFADACPVHGCLLISGCPNCGAEIRYQKGNVGLAPLLWLETWPACTNCLRTMQPPFKRADGCLVQVTSKWATALGGRRPYRWITARQFLGLSAHVIRSFERAPHFVAARSLAIEGKVISPQHAAAFVLSRLWRARVPPSLAHAALGMQFEPSQLAKDMVS